MYTRAYLHQLNPEHILFLSFANFRDQRALRPFEFLIREAIVEDTLQHLLSICYVHIYTYIYIYIYICIYTYVNKVHLRFEDPLHHLLCIGLFINYVCMCMCM